MKKYLGVKIVEAEPAWKTYNQIDGTTIYPKSKHPEPWNGCEDGYKVVYEDGYVSWSPKENFEKAYRSIDGLTFGLAIEALKQGHKVARAGWNGREMWLKVVNMQQMDASPDYPEVAWTDYFVNLPTIAMKTADDKLLFGWLASQTDMLAEDWQIVE